MEDWRCALLLLAVLAAGLAAPAKPSAAQEDRRCFPQTGFCISGRFRLFWEQNGGLSMFGYPITEQRYEFNRDSDGGIPGWFETQWFERVRMDLHSENRPPFDIQLGRMGEARLRQQGRDPRAFSPEQPAPGCHFFVDTGHNVCGAILRMWQANSLEFDGRPGISEAESLELYGLPLTPLIVQRIAGRRYQVQWFERARMELHPENAPPYDVLLGRLAAETRAAADAVPGPRLLYVGDNSQLYRVNSDGGGLTRLPLAGPRSASLVLKAIPSPDGRTIAAIIPTGPLEPGKLPTRLVIADRQGRKAHVLASNAIDLAWSSDGRLVFARNDGQSYHLYIINADGSGEIQLTTGTSNDIAPQWSPDGRTIAFLRGPNTESPLFSGQRQLTVVPAVGGKPRRFATVIGKDFVWIPGGHELMFGRNVNGISQIVALDPKTGSQRTITNEDAHAYGPAISPDGRRLAYFKIQQGYSVGASIMVANIDGSGAKLVGDRKGTLRWSPDGRKLAFVSDARTHQEIYLVNADGSGLNLLGFGWEVIWLP